MMNPNAFVFWAFIAGVGWLVGGPHMALVSLIGALGVSFFIGLLPD